MQYNYRHDTGIDGGTNDINPTTTSPPINIDPDDGAPYQQPDIQGSN